MFGIGPLLPYTRTTEKPQCPSSKASNPGSERTSHAEEPTEHAISSRPSPKLSTSTFVEASEEHAVEVSNHESCHRRDPSLIVNFDLERTVQQLRAGDSSDLDLALFAYWIRAKEDNYVTAQGFVRELALDQVSKVTQLDFCSYPDCRRVTTSTKFRIHAFKNCCKTCTIFAQGLYLRNALHQL